MPAANAEVSGRVQARFAGPLCWLRAFVESLDLCWILPAPGKRA